MPRVKMQGLSSMDRVIQRHSNWAEALLVKEAAEALLIKDAAETLLVKDAGEVLLVKEARVDAINRVPTLDAGSGSNAARTRAWKPLQMPSIRRPSSMNCCSCVPRWMVMFFARSVPAPRSSP